MAQQGRALSAPASVRVAALVCAISTLFVPSGAAAQSLLERTPNMGGTWLGTSGTLHFHFLHRFAASPAPARKVVNTPTFLLAASLPWRTLVGARYATSSLVAPGFPNEWEFFARVQPLSQQTGPFDVAVHGGYNHAASSFDGELTLARTIGPVRLLAAGRAFSDAFRSGESRSAVAGGVALRLSPFLSLGGDIASMLDLADDEDPAWSAGLQLQIPTTPHTLSLQMSNANTTTLQGASTGQIDRRYGFEFTIPLTLSRYIRAGRSNSETVPIPAVAAEAPEVTMTNQLGFQPAAVRIKVGGTVTWRNTSALTHTVTADRSRAQRPASVALPAGATSFNSGEILPGGVFTRTFTVPGEYRYFCIPHELAGMTGTVIVEP